MDCNVLIIGSGPGGMSAAHHLGRLGVGGVTVLERMGDDAYARYHSICGEAISDRMIRKVGIRPEGVTREVDAIGIDFPGGVSIRIPVKGVIVDRVRMLRSIRDSLGCRIIRGNAASVSKEGDRYMVRLSDGSEIRCNHLIGADGAHSTVRRDIFGKGLISFMPIVNNIVEGDGGSILRFMVGRQYLGGYKWEFPSSEGRMSVGYPKGTDDVPAPISRGARDMPIGRLDRYVDGRCYLVGDAACMPNQLCFGGIGAAMLSGRKAAEAVAADRPGRYQKWASGCILTDPHFKRAHDDFTGWDDADIARAMKPFRNGYSIPRGLIAIVRNPRWANVYMSCWIGFSRGW